MTVDPRTPCLIGQSRKTWHPSDVGSEGAPEPLEMWHEVSRGAACDAGAPGCVKDLDSIQVVYCQGWQYDDPPRRLAERLGADPRHRVYSAIGGTTPQVLLGETAQRMLAGEMELALVVGGEALATRRRIKMRGERPNWSFPPSVRAAFPLPAPLHPSEVAHGIFDAWLTFAVFDSSLRSRRGTPMSERGQAVGALLSPLAKVAASNPDAWFRLERLPEEIAVPSPQNRMVAFPYTKYATAIMDVDMAAGFLMATTEKADALGVPLDRRIYLRGWSYAEDPWYLAERTDMSKSVAMREASAEALRMSGLALDDIAYMDIYSCFASAVEFSKESLGLGAQVDRSITLTGGLAYHGGPGHNYVSHAIGTLAEVLRENPGSHGLVSGVGMHMSKHAFSVWSSEPGPGSLESPDLAPVQRRVDMVGKMPILDSCAERARVVAYSVAHSSSGEPAWGVLVCDVPSGGPDNSEGRIYARLEDPDDLAYAESEDLVGTEVRIVALEPDRPGAAGSPSGAVGGLPGFASAQAPVNVARIAQTA